MRLRAREVLYSEAVSYYCKKLEIPDPRPRDLLRDTLPPRGPWEHVDALLRRLSGSSLWPPGYWLWLLTLAAFIVADIVAFACTHTVTAAVGGPV